METIFYLKKIRVQIPPRWYLLSNVFYNLVHRNIKVSIPQGTQQLSIKLIIMLTEHRERDAARHEESTYIKGWAIKGLPP